MRLFFHWLLRLTLLVVVLLLAAGTTIYLHPIWVADQQIHFNLWRSGVRSEYVQVGAYRIHYYEAQPNRLAADRGLAKPLVLVHGWGARGEDWSPLIPKLAAQGFHVYALDLLGYGRSPQPDVDYSIKLQAQVVSGFMQTAGIGHADVAGWSMGGWVAAELALDEPARVDRLVLLDSAGLNYRPAYDMSLFFPTDVAGVEALVDHLQPHPQAIPAFIARAALRKFAQNSIPLHRSMQAMQGGKDILDARLPGLRQPLLVMWGKQDQLIPVDNGERMHALVPASSFEVVDGCGHLMPAQCATSAASGMVEFLRSEPAIQGITKEMPKVDR